MADVVKRKIAKAKAKATFTNLRRGLLVAIDEPEVDKDKIKYNLVLLENGLNAVMEIITELSSACSTSQDSVFLDGLCKDADDLENQYTDAVTRASTVLASMSRYNSTCTSEATGVRYSRNPDRVREYLESVSAARTVRAAQDQLQQESTRVESTHMQSSTTGSANVSVSLGAPTQATAALSSASRPTQGQAVPSYEYHVHEYSVDQGPPDIHVNGDPYAALTDDLEVKPPRGLMATATELESLSNPRSPSPAKPPCTEFSNSPTQQSYAEFLNSLASQQLPSTEFSNSRPHAQPSYTASSNSLASQQPPCTEFLNSRPQPSYTASSSSPASQQPLYTELSSSVPQPAHSAPRQSSTQVRQQPLYTALSSTRSSVQQPSYSAPQQSSTQVQQPLYTAFSSSSLQQPSHSVPRQSSTQATQQQLSTVFSSSVQQPPHAAPQQPLYTAFLSSAQQPLQLPPPQQPPHAAPQQPSHAAPQLLLHAAPQQPSYALSTPDQTRSGFRPYSQNPTLSSQSARLPVTPQLSPPALTPSPDSSSGQSPHSAAPSDVYRHLKKITIPTFSGDKKAYDTWRTAFMVCVDQQPISAELKLLQLRQCLTGPPLKSIEAFGYSASAYSAAISRLEHKYGGLRRKTAVHMTALSQFTPIRDRGTAAEFERFADLLQVAIINLQDVGRHGELAAGTFCTQVQQKLGPELLTNYNRWRCDTGAEESVPHLLQWVLREADFRTEADETLHSIANMTLGSRSPPSAKPSRFGPATASALAVLSTNPCAYCSQDHAAAQCSVITSLARRKEIVKQDGRCFVCLKQHHMARNCQSTLKCAKCSRRHHVSICDGMLALAGKDKSFGTATRSGQRRASPAKDLSTEAGTSAAVGTVGNGGAVLLQTANATVCSPADPTRTATVKVVMDGGSQRSFVAYDVTKQLGLPTLQDEWICLNPFGSREGSAASCVQIVRLRVQCTDGGVIDLDCVVSNTMCPPVHNQHPHLAAQQHAALEGLPLADDSAGTIQIDVLIGADFYWKIATGDARRNEDGPTAIGTRLGWVLSGPSAIPSSSHTMVHPASHASCNIVPSEVDVDKQLLHAVQKFWTLEYLGITTNEPEVMETFLHTIQHDGRRYVVNLSWREMHRMLPDNHQLCERRLQSTLKKLRRLPQVRKEYDAVMKQQLELGIVELVPSTESDVPGNTHYLPHHPVIREDKSTTKVRVVYDASAKVGTAPSLNECLHTGPPLMEHIPDILMRFRVNKLAVTADIEKAFLMVGIAKEDRDVLRFLWVDDVNSNHPNTLTYRFTRVVFGVSSSPFLLNATIHHHMDQYAADDPQHVEQLIKSLYVDDVAGGDTDEEAAYTFYVKSKVRLAEAGFNLRKFASNSEQLMARAHGDESDAGSSATDRTTVTQDVQSYAKSTLNTDASLRQQHEKVLGLPWNRKADTLVLDVRAVFAEWLLTPSPSAKHCQHHPGYSTHSASSRQ